MRKNIFVTTMLAMILLLVGCSLFMDGKPWPANDEFTDRPTIDMPSYEGLDYKEGEVLIRAASPALLEDLADLNSMVLQTFDEIGWVLASVPQGMTVLEFMDRLEILASVITVQPNTEWYLPISTKDFCGPGTLFKPKEITVEAENIEDLWGMENIKADKAWEVTTGNPKVLIVIVDSGLDFNHPEFSQHFIINPHNTCGDMYGGADIHGHGTHVAGTAAANGRYEKIAGVAWDCPIMPIRVMDLDGYIYDTYLGQAMINVTDFINRNPEYRAVVNMSLGGRGYSHFFKDAIDYAADNGILLVAAAGNDYKRVLAYPSAYNGVVSVTASTPFGERADFSTKGFWTSVAAPGVRIFSSIPTYMLEDYNEEIPYTEMDGTSMATPHVTGAAALLLSHYPDLTPLQIKNQLEETARAGAFGDGFAEELGYGIIDCEALLGDLQPMKYGSLKVETDIESNPTPVYGDDGNLIGMLVHYGTITLHDETHKVQYYGSTGTKGYHKFWAMLPGTYTLTLSYNGVVHATEIVTIEADKEKVLVLNLRTE